MASLAFSSVVPAPAKQLNLGSCVLPVVQAPVPWYLQLTLLLISASSPLVGASALPAVL